MQRIIALAIGFFDKDQDVIRSNQSREYGADIQQPHSCGSAGSGCGAPQPNCERLAVCRPGCRCLDRLYRSGQFRHQHPGWVEIWLCAALGGAGCEPDRHAVSGALRQARHRDRTKPGRAVAGLFSTAYPHPDVDSERDCSHGDRPGGVPWRVDRVLAPVRDIDAVGHGHHGDSHLRDPDVRRSKLPQDRAVDWRLRRRSSASAT